MLRGLKFVARLATYFLAVRGAMRYSLSRAKGAAVTIQSWGNKEAEAVFYGSRVRAISVDIAKAARRRLAQLDGAQSAEDMRAPPGNRLHLVGDRWSISVNDQYRITFIWGAAGPEAVWLGDYH